MADIIVSEFMDERALQGVGSSFDLLYDPKLVDDTKTLMSEIGSAKALIVRNRTQVNAALLESAPHLQVVGRLGVGLDNIDLDACEARNIKVCPATGANDLSVAEYVINSAMMLFRRAYTSRDAMINGEWPRQQCAGNELSGKLLGLIGYGAIARETAARAKSMGMKVIAYDPYLPEGDPAWGTTQIVSFERLVSSAHAISLHVPFTNETKNLIDAGAMAKMGPGAIIINAARGGVVDEAALCEALKSGHLGGAALDVFENEPLTKEDGQKFYDIANLILTPHIAGVTNESNVRVSKLTVENVMQELKVRAS